VGPDPFDPGEFAPAKVNLCLHVTGRRADGYHLLDSLVVFAGVGDRVTMAPAPGLTLVVTGPEAMGLGAPPQPQDTTGHPVSGSSSRTGAAVSQPPDHQTAGAGAQDNLVLRAARAMGIADAALTLRKELPVASGIGGGSADAAATLRLLQRMTGRSLPDAATVLSLGADVPVCLSGKPVRMRGVGDDLSPLPPLPPVWLVLANPRVPVPTPAVFRALERRENAAVPELPASALASAASLGDWLSTHARNDLVTPALAVAPVLATVQSQLEAIPGCRLARMSGSGGTHFGIFESRAAAEAARQQLQSANPGWWVAAAPVLGS
jgi:4-diphosphocytidyl-2-C-methyl-D-erythritol kinase